MTTEIKKRIEKIRRGEVPKGYKRANGKFVPIEWESHQMGELYTERKEAGDPTLPILSVSIHSGVSDGELDEDDLGKKVKRIADKTQYKTAYAGDLVFNMMRAWQGGIGVANTDGLISPAYIVAAPNEKIYPLFMNAYIKTSGIINSIHRQSYGITDFRLRLYWDSFAPILCTLPSVAEQQKIANILTTQDKVIDLKEKRLAEKQRQKECLMQQLLTGDKRLSGTTGKWSTLKLHNISDRLIQRNARGNENVLTISAQYGLINQTDYFDKAIASNDKNYYFLLQKDDFAYNKSYSSGYPFGAVKRLTQYDDGIVSPLYICFRITNPDVSLNYIEQYFEAGLMNKEIQAFAQEGARNHGLLNISIDDFFNVNITLPSYQEQIAIAAVLTTADREIELLQNDLNAERQKKKALMQLLLTGIVRV